MALAFLAALLPLAFLLVRLLDAKRAAAAAAVLALAALFGLFLFSARHEDAYSGLDTAAYGSMADALAAGRPLVSHDALLAAVPPGLAPAFLYRPASASGGARCRPTRDCAFQAGAKGGPARPFYIPAYSLAEAGSRLGRGFMPLLGALWVAILLAAACRRGGLPGLLPAAALLGATAYPSWFFRGEFADAAGALLASAVFLSASAKPLKSPAGFAAAAFALGYSTAFHATAILLAAPIALALLPSAKRLRDRLAFLAGGVAGLAPLCLLTHCVCAPYGDWTRPGSLGRVVAAAPEHAALFSAAAILAALGLAAFLAAGSGRARRLAAAADRALAPWGWLALALLPGLLLLLLPTPLRHRFRLAANLAWASLRAPALLLWAVGTAAVMRRGGHRPARMLWTLLSWTAAVFMLVLGQETVAGHGGTAGVWGFRRLLPPVLAFAALFAVPLAGAFAAPRSPRGRAAFVAALLVAALANPLRFPVAYFGVNGKGCEGEIAKIRDFLDRSGNPLVVFDYFPHALPFAAQPGRNVLGLGEHAKEQWPAVAAWLADVAQTGSVFVVSSYAPAALEEGFALEPAAHFGFHQQVVKSKGFLDATRKRRRIANDFLRVVPAGQVAAGALSQSVSFLGSPAGLRGDWCFTRKGGAWSRPLSGIVGPLPSPGVNVVARFDVSWLPPEGGKSNQLIRIDFPGNRYLAFATVGAGRHTIETVFTSEKPLPPIGVYTIAAPKPYDPALFGVKGYPADLGVFFHGATFRQVPASPPQTAGK